MKKDGHIHTPFCPHGTNDSLAGYVERAIELGYEEVTFAEHAPLPGGFTDPTPNKDSAMKLEEMEAYLQEIEKLKANYRQQLKINTGLEIDFIEGYEEEIESFLSQYGPYLDDAILSVHFLKYKEKYDCLDYSPKTFAEMIERYGTIGDVYRLYYKTLLQSIESELGPFKPKRVGHITLVKKFQKKFPITEDFSNEIETLLKAIKRKGYELDYNGAGYYKPLCGESYPPISVAKEALKIGIPIIYGSDAHQINELEQGRNKMFI